MTIPNVLTIIRILLTPLLVWLLMESRMNQALAVFFLAGLTDGLDGLIARLFHQKTKLGAFLDPLADKLLLVSSFILLGHIGLVPDWLVIITVSRDAMILLGLVSLMFHHIPVEIRPSLMSKITTLLQLTTIMVVLCAFYVRLPFWAYWIIFGATAAMTVASGLQYLWKGLQLLDNRRGASVHN
jgi:cardiolipin synthase